MFVVLVLAGPWMMTTLVEYLQRTLQAIGITANVRIIEATAKRMQVSMDRVVVTVQDHGNTSAASIPLALDTAVRDGRIQRGQHLLLEGVGGGFTWGSVLLKY